MNKKLIALALASAFAAPMATAADGVTMYGQVDMSVNSVDTDSSVVGADGRMGGVSSNASRFGIKGSEDLGGDLQGIWQIEQGVNLDGDAGGVFGSGGLRNSFLGLAGRSWGSVKLGNIDTPYKSSTGRLDMFADTYGDYNAIIGSFSFYTDTDIDPITGLPTTYTLAGSNRFDLRQPSSVLYESPSFGGFSVAAMYGFGNEAANNFGNNTAGDRKVASVSANFANGPFYVSLAYEDQDGFAVAASPSTPSVDGIEVKGAKLGLGFNTGNLMLTGVYERLRFDDGIDSDNRNAWMLGVGYNIGQMVLKAQYAKAGEFGSDSNDGAKYYAVGLDYKLSKRTKLYALYTSLDNDDEARYTFGNATSDGFVSDAGTHPTAISIGARHTF